ncbi:MAG: DUF4266 domain-containing protein [Deltaproteobacteria bacterium]|nr:DUF4266 domain-containing protein [Deltaproteobacteria bacterium]
MRPRALRFVVSLALLAAGGCAIVPRYQREAFANPAMDSQATALEDRSLGKLRGSREVAAGGDGRAAGGGCACSN